MLALMYHLLALLLVLYGAGASQPDFLALGLTLEIFYGLALLRSRWNARLRRRPELEST